MRGVGEPAGAEPTGAETGAGAEKAQAVEVYPEPKPLDLIDSDPAGEMALEPAQAEVQP